MGLQPEDAWCRDRGFPVGPTYESEPHASSEDGGVGLAANQLLVSFIDNHDLERFLHKDADPALLHVALFFMLTWDGIPCLYYGTEQRFFGGNDPHNREDMALGNPTLGYPAFDTSNDTFKFIQAMVTMRKQLPPLRRGRVDVRWSTDSAPGLPDHGVFAFERTEDNKVLVVVNTSEQESRTCAAEGGCMRVDFAPGTTLEDIAPQATGATFVVAADQTVDISVGPRAGRILVAR